MPSDTNTADSEVEKLVRDIVKAQYPEMKSSYSGRRLTIARLALLEGERRGMEKAAGIAENWGDDRKHGEYIATAIRSAKP